MNTKTPTALLFDIGNVLIEIDFMRVLTHWSGHSGKDIEYLRSRFTADEAYERHERGEIDASAYFASLRHSLGIEINDEQFAHGWNAIFIDEIAGMRELLLQAARHRPLYAFSNTNTMHHQVWGSQFEDLMIHFERIFVSSELGQRKPELDAYHRVAREMGVAPDEVLFFDDSQENIDGAHEAGMQAVHVRSIEDVRSALVNLVATG